MANEYLKRTPTSTGNRKVWTWAGWVKINKDFGSSDYNTVWSVAAGVSNDNSDRFHLYHYNDGRWVTAGTSSFSAVFTGPGGSDAHSRDPSSWIHICLSVDTTTSSLTPDKIQRFWVNGVEYNYDDVGNTAVNANLAINGPYEHYIGTRNSNAQRSYDGQMFDLYVVDGQSLTPDVFGFYKVGKGYVSAGSTQSTDFRPGQWVPKTPRVIKTAINNNGGFGVNGFYLPMNDSNNYGADFHGTPNSIIKLQENLPQPRCRIDGVGDYTGALRDDPFKQYLVLALPFVSGGLQSGFGDYSAAIKGSGTSKSFTANGNVAIANTAGYYGSSSYFDGNGDYLRTSTNISDFQFGTGDFTIETWLWKSANGANNYDAVATLGTSGNATDGWFLEASATRGYYLVAGGAGIVQYNVSANTSQWNHLAICRRGIITTMYLNGVAVGINPNSSYTVPATATTLDVGGYAVGAGNYWFNGYLQDLRIYKGVAKYKGGFDVPKPYTPVGIESWRAVPDTTANNFATLNPLAVGEGGQTYSEGNLKFVADSSSAWHGTVSTIGVSTGKWYVELLPTSVNAGYVAGVPMTQSPRHPGTGSFGDAESDTGIGFALNGSVYTQGSATNKTNSGYSQGDYIGLALDLDNRTVDIYTNGSDIGGATSIDEGTYYFGSGSYTQSTTIYNFGQNPTFSGNTTAGTFTDSNSKGLFKYEPPSGFLALCEDNLPTPAISDPGEYFRTVLYTGDSNAGRSIVGVGFTPDLVWVKHRNTAGGHGWFDSVRGPGLRLDSQSTGAETSATGVMSFDSDGFSLGSTFNTTNIHTVAWCWKAGGAAVSNTDGSITSVVSVNQDAGFSIVSYTGNGTSSQTVGHGLGVAPSMVIVKNRDRVASWIVRHSSLPANQTPLLENTVGYITTNYWESTYPSSTVFTISNNSEANANNENLIAYCFSEVAGYNKFGSYTGNGSTDGPFVFTNGKPAFVMIKRTDSTGDWYLFDSSRNSSNPVSLGLISNTTQIDGDYTGWGDFLSNGFKIRRTDGAWNASGGTYIFAAFAESPFQTANAK
jgi:hypothetical protein